MNNNNSNVNKTSVTAQQQQQQQHCSCEYTISVALKYRCCSRYMAYQAHKVISRLLAFNVTSNAHTIHTHAYHTYIIAPGSAPSSQLNEICRPRRSARVAASLSAVESVQQLYTFVCMYVSVWLLGSYLQLLC